MRRRDFLVRSVALALLPRILEATPLRNSLITPEATPPPSADLYPQFVAEGGLLFDYSSCIFVRGGKSLVTAGIGDGAAVLWDVESGKELRRFVHGDTVVGVTSDQREDLLLTFGGGRPVAKLWDLATGRNLQTFRHHTGLIVAGTFTPDGRNIVTASQDESVCVWSADSSHPQHVIAGAHKLDTAAFTPDASLLVFRSTDDTIKVFDPARGRATQTLPHTPLSPRPVVVDHPIVFSRDGVFVAVYVGTSDLLVYELRSAQFLWSLHLFDQFAMAFTPSNEGLALISSDFDIHDTSRFTTRLRVLDARSGSQRSDFALYSGDFRKAPTSNAVAFGPTSDVLVSCHQRGSASLLNCTDGSTLREFTGTSDPVNCLAMSPDSTLLAVGNSGRNAYLWDLTQGAITQTFGPHEIQPLSIRFDGNNAVASDEPNFFRRWTLDGSAPPMELNRQTAEGWLYPVRQDGQLAMLFPGQGPHMDPTQPLAKAGVLGVSSLSELTELKVWEPGQNSQSLPFHGHSVGLAIFGPDGTSVFAFCDDQVCKLDLAGRKEVWRTDEENLTFDQLVVSPQLDRFLVSGHDDDHAVVELRQTDNGSLVRTITHDAEIDALAFSADGKLLATGDNDGQVLLWNESPHKLPPELKGHSLPVSGITFFPAGDRIATASQDGTVRLWNVQDGSLISTLIISRSGWIVVAPDGRFDTNNLDQIQGFHWVFADDPFRPLAAENYLRNYYQPQLLPRLLKQTKKDPALDLPPLASLNRARPRLSDLRLARGNAPGTVSAEVDVEGGDFTFEETGKIEKSGAYDLRLFREGQLVAQHPVPKESTPDGMTAVELEQWRRDTVVVEAGNKQTVRFDDLQLPHGGESDQVKFTAYAFNEVRVKSDLAKNNAKPLTGSFFRKAYLISIGVNDYGGSWDLQYAVKDALRLTGVLSPHLETAGYSRIETFTLVSDDLKEEATKANIEAAIRDIAARSSPDDLVLTFFSGHGYTGKQSDFFLLPSDSNPGRVDWSAPSPNDLGRMISASDLARWFQAIVADEVILIIDACHSAASIEAGGFRPGPLGAKGFGQLAYDKKMRVLAASQSDQSAREMGGQIGEGVLTYALLHDGLEANQAADLQNKITLKNWLTYPSKRVPQLFAELRAGHVNDFGVTITKDATPVSQADAGAMNRDGAIQNPALFDFAGREGPVISVKSK